MRAIESYASKIKQSNIDAYKKLLLLCNKNPPKDDVIKEFLLQEIPSNSLLLECGCGLATELQGLKSKRINLDITLENLLLAKKAFPHENFLCGDAECLPIKDESVGIVFVSSLLHHLPYYDRCIKESYRVLKKDGNSIL